LLRLAVDIDPVTNGIFRLLVFQLIHWLTRNSKFENPETMAMLECVLEGVSSQNGSLRDFSGDCVSEFLKYSIKQTSVTVFSLFVFSYIL
jgi:DNA-dependent protein kinase catalytic subunit